MITTKKKRSCFALMCSTCHITHPQLLECIWLINTAEYKRQIKATSKHLQSTHNRFKHCFFPSSGQSFKGFLFCCSHKYVISHLISNLSPLTNRHMVLALPRPWPRNEYAYPGTSVACYPGMNSTQA